MEVTTEQIKKASDENMKMLRDQCKKTAEAACLYMDPLSDVKMDDVVALDKERHHYQFLDDVFTRYRVQELGDRIFVQEEENVVLLRQAARELEAELEPKKPRWWSRIFS